MIAHNRKTGRLEFNILINNFAMHSVKFACTNILGSHFEFSLTFSAILDPDMHRKHGSSVVRGPSLVLEVPGSIPACRESPNTLSLVSFAGMTLDKSIDLQTCFLLRFLRIFKSSPK